MADQLGAGPDTPASARVCDYRVGGRDHYGPTGSSPGRSRRYAPA